MATHNENKIKKLLSEHKQGTVCLVSWLEELGISRDLQKHYRKSHWLESLGVGAFKRPDEEVGWQGGLYALQTQAKLPIHVGAITALGMQGLSHYVRLGNETVFLFLTPKTTLPKWYREAEWQNPIKPVKTSMLPEGVGLITQEFKTFSIQISAPERAILECLYLAPDTVDLLECYQIMEGLVNLRPKLLMQLLEPCTSVKVKRLFLYMAKRAGHAWLKHLEQDKIDLGSGTRSLLKGGVFDPEFRLMLPKELVNYGV